MSVRTFLLGVAALLALLPAVTRRAVAGQARRAAAPVAVARSAEMIVLGNCEVGTSLWTGDPPIIVTQHQCHVERTFKGGPAETVTVQVLGGRVGDVTMDSSASVRLTPGADVVLLLRHSQFGPYAVVAGGARGVLPVVRTAQQRSVHGMSLADFGSWVSAEAAPR
jgi:hypothetical protein